MLRFSKKVMSVTTSSYCCLNDLMDTSICYVDNSIVAMATDQWRPHTYNSRGAWYT